MKASMAASAAGERAHIVDALSAVLKRQRKGFLRDGPPSLERRRADLAKLRQAIKDSADRIADVISADFGNRSRHESLLSEVFATGAAIRHSLRHLANWMRPKRVPVNLELQQGRARILFQPVGIVGIISPWNYPFQLAIIPLATALAAGNRVMLKPSELAPRTAEFIAEFLAGLFPSEQVATVLGDHAVGAALSGLPLDHLLYTGSTDVGRLVMRAAAENLTPVTLELGGKSPCIIGEDAALPAAVESILYGKLMNAGQSCIAPDYVLVPAAMREDFIRLAGQAVRKMYPKLKSNPDYTSVINERHYKRITQYVEEAKAAGVPVVELVPTNEQSEPDERKLRPMLVIEPNDELALMRDEIFGPVLPIKTYSSISEAIAYINRHPRPLALYYFGTSAKTRDEVLRRTFSGGVSINTTLMHALVEGLPFGGTGASGFGAYHGEAGFQTLSHRKSVFLQGRLNFPSILRPPFGALSDSLIRLLMMR
jgi:coniferyl-aldehyde dehydrogenase